MQRIDAIYARQSIDKPDSISIESQIEQCKYETRGTEYQVFFDQGCSGKDIDRPQFQKLLTAVKNGEISRVICYKLDRCSRSILDFTQLMALFQSCDVEFVSCTEKFDTSTPMGRAMLNICIVFAQLERETIQQRITDAYHARCKRGFFMGGRVPFGFKLRPYVLDGKKTSCYAVIDEEAEIIKRMYSVYELPDTSLSDVTKAMKDEQINNPRREDGLWIRPHIGRMLKNPIYVRADESIYRFFQARGTVLDNEKDAYIGINGCYLYQIDGTEHLVLAPHEGIVSSDSWLCCQRKNCKKGNTKKSHKGYHDWLIEKMICGKCGSSVGTRTTIGKNGKTYRYYVCSRFVGVDRQCDNSFSVRSDAADSAVTREIENRLKVLAEKTVEWPIDHSPHKVIRQTLRQLAQTLDNSPDVALIQLEKDFLALSHQAHWIRSNKAEHTDLAYKRIRNRLYDILSHWPDMNQTEKASVFNSMISSIQLDGHTLTIRWRV